MNYKIITTARNEADYILQTLKSVSRQTKLPEKWVIVNDGSSDNTGEIISEFAQQYNWIEYLELVAYRPDLKSTGGRVGHILNHTLNNDQTKSDIIVKLDADTSFESDFFERLIKEFEMDDALGVASGWLVFNGKVEHIAHPETTTRGAVMLIKSEVLERTNGFLQSKGRGEDRLLSVAARSFGMKTVTFPVYFNHLKPESKRHSIIHEHWNTGYYKGSIPYGLGFFLLTQVKYALKHPFLFGSLIQILGYIESRYVQNYRPFPHYIAEQLDKEQSWLRLIK